MLGDFQTQHLMAPAFASLGTLPSYAKYPVFELSDAVLLLAKLLLEAVLFS